MKFLSYLILAMSTLFACNETTFRGSPIPARGESNKTDALDVSDFSDINEEQAREQSRQAPEVAWQDRNQTNLDGTAVPLPGGRPWSPSLPEDHEEHVDRDSVDPSIIPPGTNIPQIPVDPTAEWPANPNTPPGGLPPGAIPPVRPTRAVVETISNCQQGTSEQVHYVDVEGVRTERVEMQVQGEFCPQQYNQLNVAFVVDFSASMGYHNQTDGSGEHQGYDPMVNGSCGRFTAIAAIVNRLQQESEGKSIRMAMIPFASNIVRPMTTTVMDLDAFARALTPEMVCRYVLQSERYRTPGAISQAQAGTGSGTNFAAALNETTRALGQATGRNVVYFITDGNPTVPNANPVETAVASAEVLRRTIANLTFNGIILGPARPQAEQVLNAVTGSPERVAYAAQAADLAQTITDFGDARIDVDHPSNSAWVYVDPYPARALALQSFEQSGPGVFTFRTQALVLLGVPGQTVLNRVVIEAHGNDGSTHRSIVVIRYRQL